MRKRLETGSKPERRKLKKMKKFVKCFALVLCMTAVSISCIGCGSGKETPQAAPSVKLGETSEYDGGLTLAAPEGWKQAGRQSSIIVKFDNPNLDGQSVFVKNPKKAQITTLATEEDAKNSGLKGELNEFGAYKWMTKTYQSRDSEENRFDNLSCTTVQFGKEYEVIVRGYRNQNTDAEGIMTSVLSGIKISDSAAPEAESAEAAQDVPAAEDADDANSGGFDFNVE